MRSIMGFLPGHKAYAKVLAASQVTDFLCIPMYSYAAQWSLPAPQVTEFLCIPMYSFVFLCIPMDLPMYSFVFLCIPMDLPPAAQ